MTKAAHIQSSALTLLDWSRTPFLQPHLLVPILMVISYDISKRRLLATVASGGALVRARWQQRNTSSTLNGRPVRHSRGSTAPPSHVGSRHGWKDVRPHNKTNAIGSKQIRIQWKDSAAIQLACIDWILYHFQKKFDQL